MDEFITHGTARPAATEHRLIAVEPLLTDLADPGLNPQQHRLPVTTGFSDTHGGAV